MFAYLLHLAQVGFEVFHKNASCATSVDDIQQIWYQKNKKELVNKMISLIPIFRA